MGLDMYLSAKKELSNYNFCSNAEKAKFKKVAEVFSDEMQLDEGCTLVVTLPIGYWRKANHIHNWFVENIQDGEDNCQSSYVSKEKLKELLEICQEVLANKDKAEELLPGSTGFFFGNDAYDEWYFTDIENTIDILEKALNLEDYSIYYQSSW